MPRLLGTNDQFAVEWHLPRLYELGILLDGEVVCEVEGAARGSQHGVLLVSHLAVRFVARTLFGSKSHVLSVGLEDVERVEVEERRVFRRKEGVLVLWRRRTDDDPTFESERLGKFATLLDEGERLVYVADQVWLGMRSGRVVVTDRRVAFFMGGVLWGHRCVQWLPLDDVRTSDVTAEKFGMHKVVLVTDSGERLELEGSDREWADELVVAIEAQRAALAAGSSLAERDEPVRVELERILGGRKRAEEIAETIRRQKELLPAQEEGEPDVEPDRELDELAPADAAPPLSVTLGSGVAAWVRANGGRLYVWGDEFGGGFEYLKAAVHRPEGVDFVQSDAVTEFELHVEDGLSSSRPVRLTRRWFGLRDGVSVNTGMSLGGGDAAG
jgi:hypothetical protein